MAEDNLEEEAQEVRELQEEQSKLRSLLEHGGFKYFIAVLKAQAETRTQKVLRTPLAGIDAAFAQEYEKGEAAGIEFAAMFVQTRLEELHERIEDALTKKEEDNANPNERP